MRGGEGTVTAIRNAKGSVSTVDENMKEDNKRTFDQLSDFPFKNRNKNV